MPHGNQKPTLGSLFAGIGGFDLGFERAGFETRWQVEFQESKRAVLAHRFPSAERFTDVCKVGAENLGRVDCITAGFPCQDISHAGSLRGGGKQGLHGARSGLFFETLRILRELQPQWVVLENVAALLSSNNCADIQVVVQSLADCGYMGCFRVLDAAHFGSTAHRRRVFLVGRLGGPAPLSILADASPVESIPASFGAQQLTCGTLAWAGPTVLADSSPARISLGVELLVAQADRWSAMVDRRRMSQSDGLPAGLDVRSWFERHGAGNAVHVPTAQWLGEKIIGEMNT